MNLVNWAEFSKIVQVIEIWMVGKFWAWGGNREMGDLGILKLGWGFFESG